jgi:hypothetical protein
MTVSISIIKELSEERLKKTDYNEMPKGFYLRKECPTEAMLPIATNLSDLRE